MSRPSGDGAADNSNNEGTDNDATQVIMMMVMVMMQLVMVTMVTVSATTPHGHNNRLASHDDANGNDAAHGTRNDTNISNHILMIRIAWGPMMILTVQLPITITIIATVVATT